VGTCAHAAGTRRTLLAAVLVLAQPAASAATPYLPASGSEVVERVPARSDPDQQALLRLRASVAAAPADLGGAASLAQRYIELARAESDPRYLGYAQAALAPWWRQPSPPPAVLVLRATIRQSLHRFPEAMADLDAAVAAGPNDPQAWLTRAAVQTVRGDYAGATASCARVSALASELAAIACLANVTGLTSRARGSAVLLEATLRRSGDLDPGLQTWALTLLAEIAARQGDAAVADARFRAALARAPRDAYLRGAYADFLLDQRRAPEVLSLLQGQDRIDGLLLRRALAQRLLPGQARGLDAARAELQARYQAAAQRGDSVHQREQARFELYLRGDARSALALARRNWEVQKEPADMRILLETALAAGDKAAAKPVLDWIGAHGVQDQALAQLAKKLGGA
jgi:predicted Zn-dependent protease